MLFSRKKIRSGRRTKDARPAVPCVTVAAAERLIYNRIR
jgi:hypothetical protein